MTEERILELLAEGHSPWTIAETEVEEGVCAGLYEGCSTELEMAFEATEQKAERILAAVGGP